MAKTSENEGHDAVAVARRQFAEASPETAAEALEAVCSAVRAASLLLDLTVAGPEQPLAITAIPAKGADWVPVFSSVGELAAWRQRCGRGSETVHYAALPGSQLPGLLGADEQHRGLLLDPASSAPLILPLHQLAGGTQ